jgi:hypothetical protein
MPSMSVETGSQFTRDRRWALLSLVRVFPNTVYNTAAMALWETRAGIRQGDNPLLAGGALVGRTAGMMGGRAHGDYLMGHGKRDDETAAQYAARSVIAHTAFPFPMAHLMAETVAPTWAGHMLRVIDPSLVQHVPTLREGALQTTFGSSLDQIVHDMSVGFNGNKPAETRVLKGLDAFARLTGVPPPPLVRSALGLADVVRGQVTKGREPRGVLDQASMIGYGERTEATPLNDAQTLTGGSK